MGVDFINCSFCNEIFADCGPFRTCDWCRRSWSEECYGKVETKDEINDVWVCKICMINARKCRCGRISDGCVICDQCGLILCRKCICDEEEDESDDDIEDKNILEDNRNIVGDNNIVEDNKNIIKNSKSIVEDKNIVKDDVGKKDHKHEFHTFAKKEKCSFCKEYGEDVYEVCDRSICKNCCRWLSTEINKLKIC